MSVETKKKFSWTYFCKTLVIIYLIVSALTALAFTGWEIYLGNVILGASLIALVASVNTIMGFTLKNLLHHEREKKK